LPKNCDLKNYQQLLKSGDDIKRRLRGWQKSMISNVINAVSTELGVEGDIVKDIQRNLARYPKNARDGLFGVIMGSENVERFRMQSYLEMDESKVLDGFPAGSPMMIWELVVSSAANGRPPLLALSEPAELPHRDMGMWRKIPTTDGISVYTCIEGDNRWLCAYHSAFFVDGNIKEFGEAWQSVASSMRYNTNFMHTSCANDLAKLFKRKVEGRSVETE